MVRDATAILFGALLLFLVQPICGKALLPRFGGTPAVWTTCMLFFQVLLLGGYAYAHLLRTRLAPRAQAAAHTALLAASILTWPLGFISNRELPAAGNPALHIVGLLAAGVGLPYFLLSATAPLVQGWLHGAGREPLPYRLYALSNLGSLAALVAYPFVLEPQIGLQAQARIWRGAYAVTSALVAWSAWAAARPRASGPAEPEAPPAEPRRGDRPLWFALPAAASVLLLAVTNQICQDISVVPFLWVAPLAIYLLTFILCFRTRSLYLRAVFLPALAAAIAGSLYVLDKGVHASILLQVAAHSATLLVGAMVCHGEVERLKPHPSRLTSFYLHLAAGGAAGGAFVTLLAPLLFRGYWELHVAIVATAFLMAASVFRDPRSRMYDGKPLWAWTIVHVSLFGLVVAAGVEARGSLEDAVEVSRSFHGVLRILELHKDEPEQHRYVLMHGRIEHGFQFRAETQRLWPTSYYSLDSGVGVAIRHHPARTEQKRPLRIGVVGLGAGTLAVYGQRGDLVRFYELDPNVERISSKYFSHRRESEGRVEVALGDARVSLDRERARGEPQRFDVLAIDAFSGDSIPVHLMTREAFELYQYHLAPDGILAYHTSSRYLDLRPVVLGVGGALEEEGGRTIWVEAGSDESRGVDSSDWILVTRNRAFLDAPHVRSSISAWPADLGRPIVWTDDYSNLFRVLAK